MAESCSHPTVAGGRCLHCGACTHDVILNGVCYFCGATGIQVTVRPVDALQGARVVPADRLRRSRKQSE